VLPRWRSTGAGRTACTFGRSKAEDGESQASCLARKRGTRGEEGWRSRCEQRSVLRQTRYHRGRRRLDVRRCATWRLRFIRIRSLTAEILRITGKRHRRSRAGELSDAKPALGVVVEIRTVPPAKRNFVGATVSSRPAKAVPAEPQECQLTLEPVTAEPNSGRAGTRPNSGHSATRTLSP
jgi:hypothetical protein